MGNQWAGDSWKRWLKRNRVAVSGNLGPASPEGHLLNIREVTLWFLFAVAGPSVQHLLTSCKL